MMNIGGLTGAVGNGWGECNRWAGEGIGPIERIGLIGVRRHKAVGGYYYPPAVLGACGS